MFLFVWIRVANFEISNVVARQLVQSKALGFFNLFDVGIVDDDLHHAEAQGSDLSLNYFKPLGFGFHRG